MRSKAQLAKVLSLQKLSLEGLREEIKTELNDAVLQKCSTAWLEETTAKIMGKVQQALLLAKEK